MKNNKNQQIYHSRPGHEQRAAMAELSKLLQVMLPTVQFAVILIVPVSQVVGAHGTSEKDD